METTYENDLSWEKILKRVNCCSIYLSSWDSQAPRSPSVLVNNELKMEKSIILLLYSFSPKVL